MITVPHDSLSIRTRSLSVPVAHTEQHKPVSASFTQEDKKRKVIFTEDSVPVFRVRVHQNMVTKTPSAQDEETFIEIVAPAVIEKAAPLPRAKKAATVGRVIRSGKNVVKKSDDLGRKASPLMAKKPVSKKTKLDPGKKTKK